LEQIGKQKREGKKLMNDLNKKIETLELEMRSKAEFSEQQLFLLEKMLRKNEFLSTMVVLSFFLGYYFQGKWKKYKSIRLISSVSFFAMRFIKSGRVVRQLFKLFH
jgi:hypothetical protein